MPHLICEYSDPVSERVNIDLLLEDLHSCLIDSKEFEPGNVKTRAYACHQWLVGESHDSKDFIHISLYLLSGRSTDVKRALSERILWVLQTHAAQIESLTVDVRDMDVNVYRK